MSFSTVRLNAAYASLTKIALEVPEGDQWKTVWEDDKPKASFVRSFPPVTAQVVRLRMENEKGNLRVSDFELFAPL